MKKFVLYVCMVLCLIFLTSCHKAATEESEVPESDLALSAVSTGKELLPAVFDSDLIFYVTSGQQGELGGLDLGERPLIFRVDMATGRIEIAKDALLEKITGTVFGYRDWLYHYAQTETNLTLSRLEAGGEQWVQIELPPIYRRDREGYIVCDQEGDLYFFCTKNDHTDQRKAVLLKLDFEQETATEILEADAYRSEYSILYALGTKIILDRASIPENIDGGITDNALTWGTLTHSIFKCDLSCVQGGEPSLVPLDNAEAIFRLFRSRYFTDPYTNEIYAFQTEQNGEVLIHWLRPDAEGPAALRFDYKQSGLKPMSTHSEEDTIRIDGTLLYDGLPVAATEKSYILQIGLFFSEKDQSYAFPVFAEISKEDYRAGRLNLKPLDYSSLVPGMRFDDEHDTPVG